MENTRFMIFARVPVCASFSIAVFLGFAFIACAGVMMHAQESPGDSLENNTSSTPVKPATPSSEMQNKTDSAGSGLISESAAIAPSLPKYQESPVQELLTQKSKMQENRLVDTAVQESPTQEPITQEPKTQKIRPMADEKEKQASTSLKKEITSASPEAQAASTQTLSEQTEPVQRAADVPSATRKSRVDLMPAAHIEPTLETKDKDTAEVQAVVEGQKIKSAQEVVKPEMSLQESRVPDTQESVATESPTSATPETSQPEISTFEGSGSNAPVSDKLAQEEPMPIESPNGAPDSRQMAESKSLKELTNPIEESAAPEMIISEPVIVDDVVEFVDAEYIDGNDEEIELSVATDAQIGTEDELTIPGDTLADMETL